MLFCILTNLQLWLSGKWARKVCWTVWGIKVQESIFVGKALRYVLPGRQTFVGVVNAKAAAEVDDLDVHEVLVVPRQHLRHNECTFQTGWWISHFFLSKYQRYIALQSIGDLLHMAMKFRKYGDVLDGAPEMHVDPHNHDSGSKSFRICLNMFACTTW